MTKEMIQRKFGGLLELMALIQNDIEMASLTWPQTISAMWKTKRTS
jgi:hypothetical protein